MIKSRFFKESEFNRCVPSCSLQDMQQETMNKLDKAREIAGIPFILNSAYRSIEWELLRNRRGTSAHTEGRAVDIVCYSDATRYKIITALLEAGFTRIGVAHTYIHADDSTSHNEKRIWTY